MKKFFEILSAALFLAVTVTWAAALILAGPALLKLCISILVTAQTAKNLERLASMCGYREIGMVVDKLTREKMISLHTDALMPGERKGKQIWDTGVTARNMRSGPVTT